MPFREYDPVGVCPAKSLRKKGKTLKQKNKEILARENQGIPPKQGKEGQGSNRALLEAIFETSKWLKN